MVIIAMIDEYFQDLLFTSRVYTSGENVEYFKYVGTLWVLCRYAFEMQLFDDYDHLI